VKAKTSYTLSDSSSQSIDNLGSVSAKEDGEVPSEEEGQLANSFFRKRLQRKHICCFR